MALKKKSILERLEVVEKRSEEKDNEINILSEKIEHLQYQLKQKHDFTVINDVEDTSVEANSSLKQQDPDNTSSEFKKCDKCDFTSNNDSDLHTHIQAQHKKKKKIKCWTCDFATKTKHELTEHNDKYWYSHRMCIEERFKKDILEEFDELKKDGFTVHASNLKTVSDWKS